MKRSAFTILELLAAAMIAGVLLTLTLSYLSTLATARQSIRQRAAALAEANNVMEVLFARRYEALTPADAAKLGLSDAGKRALTTGSLEIKIQEAPEGRLEAKQLTVEVHWQNRRGMAAKPVRISAWRYKISPGEQP